MDRGNLDELTELKESITGIMKQLQQSVNTIQEEMLDKDVSLEEIKQWTTDQKHELDRSTGTSNQRTISKNWKNRDSFTWKLKYDTRWSKLNWKKLPNENYNAKNNC